MTKKTINYKMESGVSIINHGGVMIRTGLILTAVLFILSHLIFLNGSNLINGKGSPEEIQTVSEVDVERYAGLWYEIAKIPNRFQKKCFRDTTADYKLRQDGRIDVVNRCFNEDGEEVVARGIAKIVDSVSSSKLKVSFVRVLGIQMFWGNYWIIGLDEEYGYAVVGEPKRKYGWILGRRACLTSEEWREVETILGAQGYDPSRFVKTKHSLKK